MSTRVAAVRVAFLSGPLGLLLTCAACGGASVSQASSPQGLAYPTVERCEVAPASITLAIRDRDAATHTYVVSIDSSGLPTTPEARRLVGSVFVLEGAPPQKGDPVELMTEMEHPQSVVSVAVVGPDRAPFGSRRLWLVRHYFDLTAGLESQHSALFFASRALAAANRSDGGSRPLWVRQTIKDALSDYRDPDRAGAMIAKFGLDRPGLPAAVPPLHQVYAKFGDRIGLVKGLPFMPGDPRDVPFIGWWGMFPLQVHIEEPGGRLREVF